MDEFDKIIKMAKNDNEVLALILFGSRAKNKAGPKSDKDLCLLLFPGKYTPVGLSRKKLEYLSKFEKFDINIFQQLPLYIKKRILKDGKILFCKDEDKLYKIAFDFITEFSDYEHILREYLQEVGGA